MKRRPWEWGEGDAKVSMVRRIKGVTSEEWSLVAIS